MCVLAFFPRQVDIVEKAEEFDKLASTLRAVATARPKKELSYVVADFDDMISLASRFKVSAALHS